MKLPRAIPEQEHDSGDIRIIVHARSRMYQCTKWLCGADRVTIYVSDNDLLANPVLAMAIVDRLRERKFKVVRVWPSQEDQTRLPGIEVWIRKPRIDDLVVRKLGRSVRSALNDRVRAVG